MKETFKKISEYINATPKRKELFDSLKTLVIALLVFLFIFSFIIMNVYIPSRSMQPLLQVNDRLIGTRFLGEIRRGDVVCFKCPDNGDTYIKRVIGLPGETVLVTNGHVYINGEMLVEDSYIEENVLEHLTWGPYHVPEGCYFMMGDNRNNSEDSRYWTTSNYVERKAIKSRALFKYFKGFDKIERITY